MNSIRTMLARVTLTLCLLLGASATALADQAAITAAFSGVWDQPDHQSQGFILQISESEDEGMIGVVYWFTYDDDLTPAWYLAVGPVNGHEIDMKLYRADGIAFLESGIEGDPDVTEVGTLLMSFNNCNQGTAAYDTPDDVLGAGEVRIKRLTSLFKQRCSGGISDNTPGNKRPTQLEVELEPVAEDSEADGKAKFWERPSRSDLMVSVEGLADGTYALEVCEAAVGEILVEEGEGSIKFRSPEAPGKLLLDFDPRDCRFDVLDGETVVLTSGEDVLAEKMRGKDEDDDDDDDDGMDDDGIEVDLENTGELSGAKGTASYEADEERTSFKVRIQNVPEGDYAVDVNGNEVGVITTESPGNGNAPARGELRFSDPQKDDEAPLDFDPLGGLIEVFDGDTVILEVVFPES